MGLRDIKMNQKLVYLLIYFLAVGCDDENNSDNLCCNSGCVELIVYDDDLGDCFSSLEYEAEFSISTTNTTRIITSNNIPNHEVGLFGNYQGSLNPNVILPQNSFYEVSLNPIQSSSKTQLLDNSPAYSFGILLNGIELDPVAAEPWPHTKPIGSTHNWEWNLEATTAGLGLDCNNAHVQPTGKYHYHGTPIEYLEQLIPDPPVMLLIGYAADGFPIYHHYGYSVSSDSNSSVEKIISSYRLKNGERPGDGYDAPCGTYNGVYTSDYEYVEGLGHLDECNGREGVTTEFPDGIYYYVITDTYPGIPRCFVGNPSSSFIIRPG